MPVMIRSGTKSIKDARFGRTCINFRVERKHGRKHSTADPELDIDRRLRLGWQHYGMIGVGKST